MERANGRKWALLQIATVMKVITFKIRRMDTEYLFGKVETFSRA